MKYPARYSSPTTEDNDKYLLSEQEIRASSFGFFDTDEEEDDHVKQQLAEQGYSHTTSVSNTQDTLPHQTQRPPSVTTNLNMNSTGISKPNATNYLQDNAGYAAHQLTKQHRQQTKEQLKFAEEDFHNAQKLFRFKTLCQKRIKPFDTMGADTLPKFSLGSLPPEIARALSVTATRFNISKTHAAITFLSTIAVACRGKFETVRSHDHKEVITLYIAGLLASGGMKTPVLRFMTQPLYSHEATTNAALVVQAERNEILRTIFQKKIKKLMNLPPTESNINKIIKLKQNIPSLTHKVKYTLFKFTPEGLETEIMKQHGVIGILGSEAGMLKTLSEKKNDLLLMGWDGDQYTNIKAGKPIEIPSVCISIGLMVQPHAILPFINNQAFQADGLLGRFLFVSLPEPKSVQPTYPVPKEHRSCLAQAVTKLLDIPAKDSRYQVEMSDAAVFEWEDLVKYIAKKSEAPALTNAMQSFYRKMAGTSMRIAGLLHLLSDNPITSEISHETMISAVNITKFFEEHTIFTLNTQKRKELALACKALRYLKKSTTPEYPVRDLYRALHISAQQCENILKTLKSHNMVEIHESRTTKTCIIHPELYMYDIPEV